VETVARPLWRATGSGAEAPPLAAHPKSESGPVRGVESAIFLFLGGSALSRRFQPDVR